MAHYIINSDIDPSNIIRQRSVRASKDKAIARIHIPFDYEPTTKKSIPRSKTLYIKKANPDVNEIEHNMRRISLLEDDDDDEEDNYVESDYGSSDSCDSGSSENNISVENDIPHKVNTKIARRKTIADGRRSVAAPIKSDICLKKTERKKMTAKSFAEQMPCRDREFDSIFISISNLICNGEGGCVFVVGTPGTGKTATVSAAIDCLEAKESNLPQFNRVTINGMHVTEVREVYSLIYKELTNKSVSKNRAVSALEAELMKKSKNKKATVILIDEIDQLLTKKEDVLYKIFGWTQRRDNRLIIVAISNTMDLPERMSQNKVTSRCGVGRFMFHEYTHEQLFIILMNKLNSVGLGKDIDSKALELATKRIAAHSGDARNIIEIFRRIHQLYQSGQKVNIGLVDTVLKEMFAQPKIAAIRDHCSFYEKLFLKAMVTSFAISGVCEAQLKDVIAQMAVICKSEDAPILNGSQIYEVLTSLGSFKLINYDSLDYDVHVKLSLNCFPEQVNFALNNK